MLGNRVAASLDMRAVIPVLLVCAGLVRAEDLTTTDGTVFRNTQVLRYEADGVVVKHDLGTNRIAWTALPAATRRRYQALARNLKETEIEKLKQDLARAEAEAAALRQDDDQAATQGQPSDKSGSSALRPAALSPAKPVAELLPVKPDEVLDAAELVRQFKDDPSGAERRYRKKSFRVKGVIARFEPLKFVRKYHVILESPDRLVSLVVVFDYLNEWRAVYTTQRGQTLVAKIAENQERVLMQTGQTIVLQGRCRGAGDSEIVITGSHLVP